MRKEFPELDKLSRIGVGFEIEEDKKSPVNIEGIKTDGRTIIDITGVGNGSIVLTGSILANCQSHIAVINMNGKILGRKELKHTRRWVYRYCAYLSELKIATVCWYDEIGIFDIRDNSYIKKNISDVSSSWPSKGMACHLTTDLVNNHILVGRYNSGDVYVFDDQLNYHHTLILPDMIKCPSDMAFSDGKLLSS
ncbi:hypothetical protein HOLleu_11384 [Holothuria leucospilota]|uniref:Uncharacterized protein n=1 Tax=Holothuria leucospilota TaxID=206669 RepID=A0A9Q1HF47_HOLLE|nr:hypothetical protein HOLleu_11384 [Holothuria leucospilota]